MLRCESGEEIWEIGIEVRKNDVEERWEKTSAEQWDSNVGKKGIFEK